MAALRVEGVAVGLGELVWLQHAFFMEPNLDRRGLRDLLACALVKHPWQRESFDILFEEWCPPKGSEAEQEQDLLEEQAAPAGHTEARHPSSPRKKKSLPGATVGSKSETEKTTSSGPSVFWKRPPVWVSGIVAVVTVFAAYIALVNISEQTEPNGSGVVEGKPPQESAADIRTIRNLPATEELLSVPVDANRWPLIVLGLGALILLLLLGLRYHRQRRLPKQEILPESGPKWLPLPDLVGGGPELLDSEQLRTLIWGIGRFVSEDLTDHIDLRCTAEATARAGGIPELRYQHAKYPQEVWLWQDETASNPALERLASELETSLLGAGLPVRRGWFADLPDPICWQEGQEFSPLILEGHRQSALVAILSDGAGLALARDSALDRGLLDTLLQGLAEWPQLVFVDFGRGVHCLASLLARYKLRCIAPEALPAFLGAGETGAAPARRSEPRLLGELRAWAAATAMSPEPVDEPTTQALRRVLGLDLSGYDFDTLLHQSKALGERVAWPSERRAELLSWLGSVERPVNDGQVPENGLLGRTLAFWRTRYEEARERRAQQEGPMLPWRKSSAEQNLRMEEALLRLWTAPEEAAKALYWLFRGELAREIRDRLGEYAPRDFQKTEKTRWIRLPWSWENQDERSRWLLARMGLAGMSLREGVKPRPSGTLALAAGLCSGLSLTILAAMFSPAPVPKEWTDPKSEITFVQVHGGRFFVGSGDDDKMAYDDEKPRHEIEINPFWIGKTEVSNAQYRRFKTKHGGDDDLPAVNVSWNEARDYCEHFGHALPTEAQWEYAARAGSETRWSFGDEEKALGRYAWFSGSSESKAHPVGTKAANAWSLHDMHGNVYEWVQDCYAGDAYSRRQGVWEDPLVEADQCRFRVLRGGAFWSVPRGLRSAHRNFDVLIYRSVGIGFRCVRVPRRQP